MYFRIDKFCYSMNAINTVIVTDNWIIKTTPYSIEVAHQSDTALVVISSDLHLDTTAHRQLCEVQYLTLEVKSSREGVKPFTIRSVTPVFVFCLFFLIHSFKTSLHTCCYSH